MRALLILALILSAAAVISQPTVTGTTKWYVHDGNDNWVADADDLSAFFSTTGIPVGGTAGQVLTKDTGTDYDVSWQTPGGGGGGSVATDAIFDAKGDLPVGTGANTAARLAVGTDASQIYADASTSTGLRWGPSLISPTQITADQANYAPAGWAACQIARIDGDAGIRAITSFAATFSGDRKTIINVGSYPIYIPSEHPDGTAANRVIGPGADYIIFIGCAIDILYDGTSSRWRIITPQQDPTSGRSMYYYWVHGSATPADYGQISMISSGTGSSQSSLDGAAGYPGCLSIGTGTTSAGAGTIYFSKSGIHYTFFGDAHLWGEWLFSVPTLSDATETYTLLFTIDDTGNNYSLNNSSVGIRYTHGTNSGKLQGFSRSHAGVESTVDLGVTVATTTVYKLRAEIDKSKTAVRFYVNSVAAGVVTGNMPNSLSIATKAIIIKSAGTTIRTLRMHSMAGGAIYP